MQRLKPNPALLDAAVRAHPAALVLWRLFFVAWFGVGSAFVLIMPESAGPVGVACAQLLPLLGALSVYATARKWLRRIRSVDWRVWCLEHRGRMPGWADLRYLVAVGEPPRWRDGGGWALAWVLVPGLTLVAVFTPPIMQLLEFLFAVLIWLALFWATAFFVSAFFSLFGGSGAAAIFLILPFVLFQAWFRQN